MTKTQEFTVESSVGYCSTQEVDVCGVNFTCEELSTYESDIGQKIPPGEQRNIRSYESSNNIETFIANKCYLDLEWKSYDVNLYDGYYKTSIQENVTSSLATAIAAAAAITHH